MARMCTSSYRMAASLQSPRPVVLRRGARFSSTRAAGVAALRTAAPAAASSSFQQQPQQQQQTRIKQQQQQWALDEESPQLRSGEPAAHPQPAQQHTQRPTRLLASAVPLLAAAGGVLGSGFSVEGPWSVAQALGALAAIIAVHEAGHFAAARLQGIHVTEFSIGFGPRLWSRKVCVFLRVVGVCVG